MINRSILHEQVQAGNLAINAWDGGAMGGWEVYDKCLFS